MILKVPFWASDFVFVPWKFQNAWNDSNQIFFRKFLPLSIDQHQNFDIGGTHLWDIGRQSGPELVHATLAIHINECPFSRDPDELEQKCVCSFWLSLKNEENDVQSFARFQFYKKKYFSISMKMLTLLLGQLASICKKHYGNCPKFSLKQQFQITPKGVICNCCFRLENGKSTPWLFCGRLKIGKNRFPDSSHEKSLRRHGNIEILWFIQVDGRVLSNFWIETFDVEFISEQLEPV